MHITFSFFLLLIVYAFYIKTTMFPVAGWFIIMVLAVFFLFEQKIVFKYIFVFLTLLSLVAFLTHTYQDLGYIINVATPILIGFVGIYIYYLRAKTILTKLEDTNKFLEKRIQEETKKRTVVLEKDKKHLQYLAYHDYLTKLPNMAFLEQRLQELIESKKENIFSLIYIDLNKYKYINDMYGHTVGNYVLKEIAHRLTVKNHFNDFIARVGGDEFLIVACTNKQDEIKKRLLYYMRAIEKPMEFNHMVLTISASMGVSSYPKDSNDIYELILYADRAMGKAKYPKEHFYTIHTHDIDGLDYSKVELEKDVTKAFEDKHFDIYFQPQINIETQEIVGLEVLVRWIHPTLGILEPKYFLELLQNMGKMYDLERVVMKLAMEKIVYLKKRYLYEQKISINVNVQTLENKNFMEYIRVLLLETGCKGEWIELEVVETEIISNMEKMAKTFDALKKLGITITIDDFGTGYSSLSYLKYLAIDKIKIDKIFVDNLVENHENITIVKAIVAIADSFNFEIVVEGVESKEQVELLLEYRVKVVQGFYYYRPMPFEVLIKQFSIIYS